MASNRLSPVSPHLLALASVSLPLDAGAMATVCLYTPQDVCVAA